MFLGRFLPIVLRARPGRLAWRSRARARRRAGTLPTHRLQFVGLLLVGVVLIVAGLTFVPALALGPLAEGLS